MEDEEVLHRIDDLERLQILHKVKPYVLHRIDDLEIVEYLPQV
ncbi:Uncharacterised protein [Acinetobacter baumannii]|nr:Uncharacterised protein [Acinetobacter baumannii]